MKFVTLLALASSSQAIRMLDLESLDLTGLGADETEAPTDETAAATEADVAAENTDGSYLAELKIDDGITINVLAEGTGGQC